MLQKAKIDLISHRCQIADLTGDPERSSSCPSDPGKEELCWVARHRPSVPKLKSIYASVSIKI
jgi:hypothetical protein